VSGKEEAAEGQGQKKRRAGKLDAIYLLCYNLRKKANHKNFAPPATELAYILDDPANKSQIW
jgi:hypothetical protein